MDRHIQTQAIVMGMEKKGEINLTLTLFSSDLGIIYVTIYGGQKSKKALRPPLFSIGTFYLQKANSAYYTLDDCKLIDSCPFTFNLQAIGPACLMAEICKLISSSDLLLSYNLLADALLSLSFNQDNQNTIDRILIQYIWQMLKIAGLGSELCVCVSCLRPFEQKEIAYFNPKDNSFCCESCTSSKDFFIGPGERKYLSLTHSLSFREALDIALFDQTAARIRKHMIHYAQIITDFKLKTVLSGMV